ncbi:MAG: hypothetical protein Q4G13_02910, partial [Moraxella sp.]|nr:hypothetical protein [Moraxella sp.]
KSKKGRFMNQDLHYLQDPFITVGAVFEDDITVHEILHDLSDKHEYKGFCYTFKAEIGSDFQVGDYAVVHARNELKVVRIVQVHDTPMIDVNANFEYKWVIQKIDFAPFKKRHAEQKRIGQTLAKLDIIERREVLMTRLKKAMAQDDEFASEVQAIITQLTQCNHTLALDKSNKTDKSSESE